MKGQTLQMISGVSFRLAICCCGTMAVLFTLFSSIPTARASKVTLEDVMERFQAVVPAVNDQSVAKRNTPGIGWEAERIVSIVGRTESQVKEVVLRDVRMLSRLSKGRIQLSEPGPETNIVVFIGERDDLGFASKSISAGGFSNKRIMELKAGYDGFRSSKWGFYCETKADGRPSSKNEKLISAYIYLDTDVTDVPNFELIIRSMFIYCTTAFQPLKDEPSSILTAGNFSASWNCIDEVVIRLLLNSRLGPTMPREKYLKRVRDKAQQIIEKSNDQPLICEGKENG